MSNKNKMDGYNPIRDNRKKCFNTDVGGKVFTENCVPLNDDCATQQSIYQDLIDQTIKDLSK